MVELDIVDDIRGPAGAVHGGVIASLVDRAGAYVAAQASRRQVVTSSVALSYLAAGSVGPLRAIAAPLRIGTQQGVVEVRVYDAGNGKRLVATALLTLSFLSGEGSPGSSGSGE